MTDAVEAFWRRAITKARINPFEVVTGPDQDSSLTPPTWTMDDASIAKALEEASMILTSPAEEHEVMPKIGGLSILLWEDGTPAALLQTSDVAVRKAAELDGSDPGDWKAVRARIPGDADVVVERFRVLVDNA